MGATAAAAQAIVTSQAGDAASPPARAPQGNLGGRRVLLDCAGLFRSCFRFLRAERNGRQAQTEGPAPTELRQRTALSARESRGSAQDEGPGDASRQVRARTFSPAPATASVLQSPPLHGEPPEGSEVGARAGVVDTGTAAVERDTGLTELPWLTHRQNDERLQVNKLLAGTKPLHVTAQQWGELRNALERVVRIETDIREADALLQRSRTDPLSEAESQRLREIVDLYRQGAMNGGYKELLRATFTPLRMVGGFETADRTAAVNLEARLRDVLGHFREETWEGPGKVVKLVLPLGKGKEIEVESRVVPGEAWRSYFPGGYHSQGPRSFTNFLTHVPGLGHTTATNARGEVIYSGLCHDLVSKQCLSAETLTRFERLTGRSGEVLKDALRNLPTNEHISEQLRVNVGAEIDRLLAGRSEPSSNALTNSILRTGVAHKMATEVALAALVTDPPKLQKALAGERVGVNLCWLVDLTEPSDIGAEINSLNILGQSSALAEKSPLELSVRGPDGQLRTVNVDLKIRMFIYDPCDQSGQAANLHAIVKGSWVELLGPLQSRELGGDVLVKTEAMAVRARELRNEIAMIDRESSTVAVGRVAAVPVSPGAGEIRAGLESELRLLEKNRDVLLRLGKQQKALATNGEFLVPLIERTSDGKVIALYVETMSQLALICHLMGETPVLSKSGGEGVKHLDVAVKFLATVADSGEGSLPPLIPDEDWLQCHKDFSDQVAPQAKSLVNIKALGMQHLMVGAVAGL